MHPFYSSLIINSRNFPKVHQVFRPRFNKEFFKRLTANIEALDAQIVRRCQNPNPHLSRAKLDTLKSDSRNFIRLKDRLERRQKETTEDDYQIETLLSELHAIEDKIMPMVVAMPNRSSKLVPDSETVLDILESDFLAKEKLSKVLSHKKLSYINNCYEKSVVGPNSHYYYGIAAKLQLGLVDFFTNELEKEKFIPISGLCLNKSAVVEASNSIDNKDYRTDPCRILTDDERLTTLHLTEASRESLISFLTTIGQITSNNPLRLMTSGSGYGEGSIWFDSDSNKVTQFETVHALSLAPSIEKYSMDEYHKIRDLIWNTYKSLGLPSRLVHCSIDTMISNEYDAHRIDIWLPSREDWIPVSRISHYLDFIGLRVGMKRGHMIDSSVYDSRALVAAIIENNQTSTGKFIIPQILRKHMIALTEEEQEGYFRLLGETGIGGHSLGAKVLSNFEQRRYLVKRNYAFSHAKKSEGHGRNYRYRDLRFFVAFMTFFAFFIDYESIWMDWFPDKVRKYLYDYIYRPGRRFIWYLTGPERAKSPKDLPYDEIDKSRYRLSALDRRREDTKVLKQRGRVREQQREELLIGSKEPTDQTVKEEEKK